MSSRLLFKSILANDEMARIETCLTAMSERDLSLLDTILSNLHLYQLFEKDLALIVLYSLTRKLPKAERIIVSKDDDGWGKTIKKELCLYRKPTGPATYSANGKPLYQLDKQHDDYEVGSGGHSIVKKAYRDQPDGSTHFYAIKKLRFNSLLPGVEELAEHEAKYPLFIGRSALIYERNRRFRVMLDWVDGDVLSDLDEDQLKLVPIIVRLQCLRYLLSEVLQFHAVFRVLGDLKPENCALNLKTKQLSCFDFGSAHKVGSKKKYAYSIGYTDTQEGSWHYFASDVYQLGAIVSRLFPEILTFDQYVGSSRNRMRLLGIDHLIGAMFASDPHMRCTVYHADQLCELLMDDVNELDSELLEHYLALTINHTTMQAEDIFWLTSRPIKLGV